MPEKSRGLQVWIGRSLEIAVAAIMAQPCGYLAEAAGRGGIKWKWLKVGFGLLKVGLASGSFLLVRRHKRSYREFGEGDRRDLWLVGKGVGFLDPAEQFGDGFPRACDGEPLTFGGAVDYVASVVAQFAETVVVGPRSVRYRSSLSSSRDRTSSAVPSVGLITRKQQGRFRPIFLPTRSIP